MTRILFVTGSLVHGGAERHSITVMNRLAERGYECHAVYVKNDPSQLDRIRLRGGGTAQCLDAARYFDGRAVADFARHAAWIRPSVVVAANPYALMYSSLALRVTACRRRRRGIGRRLSELWRSGRRTRKCSARLPEPRAAAVLGPRRAGHGSDHETV